MECLVASSGRQAASDLKLSLDPSLEGAQFFHFSEHLQEWVHLQKAEKEALALLGEVENAYQEACHVTSENFVVPGTSDVVELLNVASTLATTINDARAFTPNSARRKPSIWKTPLFGSMKPMKQEMHTMQISDSMLEISIHCERLDPQVAEYQEIASRLQLAKTKLEGYSEQIP